WGERGRYSKRSTPGPPLSLSLIKKPVSPGSEGNGPAIVMMAVFPFTFRQSTGPETGMRSAVISNETLPPGFSPEGPLNALTLMLKELKRSVTTLSPVAVAVSIGAGVDGGLAREEEGTASSVISTTPKSSLERGTGPNTNRATRGSPSQFRSIAWVRRPAEDRATPVG